MLWQLATNQQHSRTKWITYKMDHSFPPSDFRSSNNNNRIIIV